MLVDKRMQHQSLSNEALDERHVGISMAHVDGKSWPFCKCTKELEVDWEVGI